ncbi:YlxR family protein [Nocardioides acrostichi]|uniref:YlxR family protein n=1 Tax=Nocardioides acrostichi TaxID=2784339 RepID=UPI002E2B757A|nr:YlxR family protein [Nocardioides acrostichi]
MPIRTCVGCRTRAAKPELLRVTAGIDDQGLPVLVADLRGGAPGRGAHIHPTAECYELAVRRRAFARALRITRVPAGGLPADTVIEHLRHLDETSTTTRNWSSSS